MGRIKSVQNICKNCGKKYHPFKRESTYCSNVCRRHPRSKDIVKKIRKANLVSCNTKEFKNKMSIIGKQCWDNLNAEQKKERVDKLLINRHKQVGENHQNWKGGYAKCIVCNKQLSTRRGGFCVSHGHSGIHNGGWKGGITANIKVAKAFYQRRRKARIRGAEGNHSRQEWEQIKTQYNNTCPNCKRKEPEIKLTEDHIIPIFKSGTDYIENIQPLCASCNSKKHVKIEPKYNLNAGLEECLK